MKTAIEELQEMVESKLTMPMGVSFKELFEQAKEMEKQQMIKFAYDFLFHDDADLLTAEQYYNETFKI
jgi:hypothetical protein